MTQPTLHVSLVMRSPLVDRAGEKLGRVEDLIVRLGDEEFPPITGLQGRIGGRDLFVPADRIATLEEGRVQLAGETLNLRRFERRPNEVLLRQDVLGRKLVHVERARLVTAHDIELMCVESWWRVVGIDASGRGMLRRLLPRRFARDVQEQSFVDWSELEPFVGHVPSARLRFPHRKLARLHPAQIADLVEAASHDEGEEIIEAVGHDRELEADVFEELDDEHQVEFIRERSDAEVASVLARMANDDAADLLVELPQERRKPVLSLLPLAQQRKIRVLLGYNPSTAGGLMGTEFVTVGERTPAADALRAVRQREELPDALTGVYLADEAGKLSGWASLVELLRTDPSTIVGDIAARDLMTVTPDADIPEVARLMTDYNLTMLPVVDAEDRLQGVITVDDLLEMMLPPAWRRRYDALGR